MFHRAPWLLWSHFIFIFVLFSIKETKEDRVLRKWTWQKPNTKMGGGDGKPFSSRSKIQALLYNLTAQSVDGPRRRSLSYQLSVSAPRPEDAPGWSFCDFMVGWASLTNSAAGSAGTISHNRPQGRPWQLRQEVGGGPAFVCAFEWHRLLGNPADSGTQHTQSRDSQGNRAYGVLLTLSWIVFFCYSHWVHRGGYSCERACIFNSWFI